MRASLSGLVFFFRSSFFFFRSFFFLLFSFAVGGLGHRQISPSLSSLHVRTLLSRIAPCLCIMFCTRLQTPAVCPIQDKCGCSPCGVFSFFVNYVGIQFRHTAKGSRYAPLPFLAVTPCVVTSSLPDTLPSTVFVVMVVVVFVLSPTCV